MKIIRLCCMIASLQVPLCAQAPMRMERLGVEEGLSQGFVTSIIQDKQGYIWLGTYDGLNRYDGYTVRRFTTKPFEEQELLLVIQNLLHLQEQWKRRYAKLNMDSAAQPMPDTGHSPADMRFEDGFMEQLFVLFEEHYPDDAFNLERLCRQLGMSSSQLDRKLKVLTDRSPMQMLRSFRLQKARAMLLQHPHLSVKDVDFQVGFKNTSHFSKVFVEEFGVPPSEVG